MSAAIPNSTVIVNIASSSTYQVGVSQQATVTVDPTGQYTSYQAWLAAELGGYSPALQTPTSDPTGDGIDNLLKYAFNLNPFGNAVAGLPQSGAMAPGDGHDYLTISYIQRDNATDISYVVQVSSDLVNWTAGPTYTLTVSSVSNGDGTSTVTVRDLTPMSAASPRFIRVEVIQ